MKYCLRKRYKNKKLLTKLKVTRFFETETDFDLVQFELYYKRWLHTENYKLFRLKLF